MVTTCRHFPDQVSYLGYTGMDYDLHRCDELNFRVVLMSFVYAWPLPEATLITVRKVYHL